MVAVSVVRPERLRIAKLRNIAGNKKVSKDVSSRRRSAAFELLNGESFREGFCFFFKVLFSMRTRQVLQHLLRHVSHTRRKYLSCETTTLNFPVKPALLYFAGLSILWSWGSCEFVSAASAKVEIWRRPVVIWFFYMMINGSTAELFSYCYR